MFDWICLVADIVGLSLSSGPLSSYMEFKVKE